MFTLNTDTLTTRPEVNAAVATVANIVITLQLDVDQLEQMFDDSVLAMIAKDDDTHLGVYALGLMEGHVQRICDDRCDQVAKTISSKGAGFDRGPLSVKVGHRDLGHVAGAIQSTLFATREVKFGWAWKGTKGSVLFIDWQKALEKYL
jgi:hypothetical protein